MMETKCATAKQNRVDINFLLLIQLHKTNAAIQSVC